MVRIWVSVFARFGFRDTKLGPNAQHPLGSVTSFVFAVDQFQRDLTAQVTLRTPRDTVEATDELQRELIEWLARGLRCTAAEHDQQSYELRLSKGMKIKRR